MQQAASQTGPRHRHTGWPRHNGTAHQVARRRRSAPNVTLGPRARTEDEAVVLRAWRRAVRDSPNWALSPRVVQTALRRAVTRARERASGFQRQRDTERTFGNIERSMAAVTGSFLVGAADLDTLARADELIKQAHAMKATALQAMQDQGVYSDADMAQALGVRPQAVQQMRQRNLRTTSGRAR